MVVRRPGRHAARLLKAARPLARHRRARARTRQRRSATSSSAPSASPPASTAPPSSRPLAPTSSSKAPRTSSIPFAGDAEFAANRARAPAAPADPRLQQFHARSDTDLRRATADHARVLATPRRPLRGCDPSAANTSCSAAIRRGAFPMAGAKRSADEQFIALLEAMAPLAKRHGITVGVEMQQRQECNYLNFIEEVVERRRAREPPEHPRARRSVPHARDGRYAAATGRGDAVGRTGGARRAGAAHAARRRRRRLPALFRRARTRAVIAGSSTSRVMARPNSCATRSRP